MGGMRTAVRGNLCYPDSVLARFLIIGFRFLSEVPLDLYSFCQDGEERVAISRTLENEKVVKRCNVISAPAPPLWPLHPAASPRTVRCRQHFLCDIFSWQQMKLFLQSVL